MSRPDKSGWDEELAGLEERVAALLDLGAEARTAGFRALRGEHPEHAELLRLWEHAADAVDDVPPSVQPQEGRTSHVERIGRYRILRRLGEGGMGVVYLAEAGEERERVALKVLRRGLDSRDLLARFEAEERALSRLSHPNIASILDSGTTEDGRPYFAMQYVPGLAIHEYCDRQQVDVRGRIALLRQACLGIHHAHEQGVLHRDLKPSNILVQIVRGDPEPVIIDFGVARALRGRLSANTLFTEHGQLLGTPEYMSPEQAEMSQLELNLRSDVYSLGVVMFELLTGGLPFSSSQVRNGGLRGVAATLRYTEPSLPSAHVAGAADTPDGELRAELRGLRPPELVRELHGALDWIVMRCLEKDPSRRYPSAQALADDLGRFLDGRCVEAGPPGLVRRCGRWLRRHRQTLAAAAAIGVLGSSAWLASYSAPQQPDLSATARARAVARFEIPSAAPPRGPVARRQVDFAVNGLRAVHVVVGVEGADDSLAIWDESFGHSRPFAMQIDAGWRLSAPRWSPTADRIAFVGSRQNAAQDWLRQVFICPAAGGNTVPVLPVPVDERLVDVCWLSDGSALVCADLDGPVFALGLDGVRVPLSSPGKGIELGGVTADGRWLVCSAVSGGEISGPRDLWVVPMHGGVPRAITSSEGNEEYPRLAADDLSVWFVHTVGRPGNVDRGTSNIHSLPFDPVSGTVSGTLTQHTQYQDLDLSELAFVHGGDDAVWRSRHRSSAVLCRTGSGPALTLGQGTQVQVSAAGELVCFVDWNFDQLAIVGCAPDGQQPPRELASLDGFDLSGLGFQVRPDGLGAVVSAVDGGGPGLFIVDFVTASGGPSLAQRVATTSTPVRPAWSADGNRLAWCDGGRLWVHDFGSGATQEHGPQVFEWEPWAPSWSPNGAELVATGYASAHDRDVLDANTIYAVAWPSGTVRALTPAGDPYKEQVGWHPLGTFLTAVYSHHAIHRIERDGSGVSLLVDDPDHIEYWGRWNGAGTKFVFQCLGCRLSADHDAHVYDLASGQLELDAGDARPYASQSLDGVVEAWSQTSVQEHFEWLRDVRD